MLSKLLKRTIREDFAVIDSLFPQKIPFAFRNAEINAYFKRLRNFSSYTMYPMLPDKDAWFDHGYGISQEQFTENKQGYLQYYPQNADRIHYLQRDCNYKFGLAYSFFLGETYALLPFLEKYKIPFVFVLYPGGCFALNNEKSDNMLKKIFQSTYFRGVIVTQQLTKQYLEKKQLCSKGKVRFIYGGFVQFTKHEVKPKRYYKQGKKTFDICFVAAKYTERGVDKGYDLFIESAKRLCRATKDVRFHVVGGFDKTDIDVRTIAPNISFYGYQQPDFLGKFYAGMDIFLGANRPSAIYPGSFDGFPLGIDASYSGVALFVADELRMNQFYTPGEDVVIIPFDAKKVADIILSYYNNPDRLYELAERGQRLTQKLFDVDHQINSRLSVFDKFVGLKYF